MAVDQPPPRHLATLQPEPAGYPFRAPSLPGFASTVLTGSGVIFLGTGDAFRRRSFAFRFA